MHRLTEMFWRQRQSRLKVAKGKAMELRAAVVGPWQDKHGQTYTQRRATLSEKGRSARACKWTAKGRFAGVDERRSRRHAALCVMPHQSRARKLESMERTG